MYPLYAVTCKTEFLNKSIKMEILPKLIKEGSNMPRKGHTQKREVLADPMYNSVVVTKLINNIMLDGKKGVTRRLVQTTSN